MNPKEGSSGAAGEQGPGLKLQGCAPSQEALAEAMVRLRRLHQAEEITLVSSEREESASGGVAAPAPSATPAPSGGAAAAPAAAPAGPQGCGAKRGEQNYKFEVSVKLAPTPDSTLGGGSVPRSLGGGS